MPQKVPRRVAAFDRLRPVSPRGIKGVKPGEPEPPNLIAFLADNLHAIRKSRQMTIKEMAADTGFSGTRLSLLERGSTSVNLDTLARLSAIYGVDPGTLLSPPATMAEQADGLKLDILEALTKTIHSRVTELLAQHGPVPVGNAHLASVLGAIFDVISNPGKYSSPPR